MARFGSCCLIPNLMPQILNTLLYTATVQNKDAVIAVELDMEVENTNVIYKHVAHTSMWPTSKPHQKTKKIDL